MRIRSWIVMIIVFLMMIAFGCSESKDGIGHVIHVEISTKKVRGAKVFWRVESTVEDVKSTNRFFLGFTPYQETRTLFIPGLTSENAPNVNIVVEIKKKGYYTIIERFNLASVLNDRRIGKSYNIYKKPRFVKKKRRVKKQTITKTTPTPVKEEPVKTDPPKTPEPYPVYSKTLPKKTVLKDPVVKPSETAVTVEKDIYEPNDSPDKAKAMYLNREYLAKMDSKTDLDHFMIFLGDKPKYKLVIDQIPANSKYQVEVMTYPKQIETVYKLTTSKNKEELTINLKEKGKTTGIYCIKISNLQGESGVYRLKITLEK